MGINNNWYQEPSRPGLAMSIPNCSTSQILIFCGYVSVRGSLHMLRDRLVWVNIVPVVMNIIDGAVILPRHEGSCMVFVYVYIYIDPNGTKNKKYC